MVIKLTKYLILVLIFTSCKKEEIIIPNYSFISSDSSITIPISTDSTINPIINFTSTPYFYNYDDGYVKLKFGEDSMIFKNFPPETFGGLYYPSDSSFFSMSFKFYINKYYTDNYSVEFNIGLYSKIKPLISSHNIGYYFLGSWDNPQYRNEISLFMYKNNINYRYYDCLGSTQTMFAYTNYTIKITDMTILNNDLVLISGEINDKLCYGTNTYNGMTNFTGIFKNIVLKRS